MDLNSERNKSVTKVYTQYGYTKFKTSYTRLYVRAAYTGQNQNHSKWVIISKVTSSLRWGPGRMMQSGSYKGTNSILVHSIVVGL